MANRQNKHWTHCVNCYILVARKEPRKGRDTVFTNKDLKNLIVPLFLEQLLVMLVGIADTFIVSYAGEAAVSGVSLVNSFSTIFIYLFTALASGGAVVISQYIGRGGARRTQAKPPASCSHRPPCFRS